MNILFSSLSGIDKTESHWYLRVLRRMGHNVFRFSLPSIIDDPENGLFVESGYSPEIMLDTLPRLAKFTPDIFIYMEPNGIIPRGMEKAPFPTACILCDTHMNLNGRKRQARFFDHVFLYHRNYLSCFDEHPSGNVHWLPYACDLDLFHPENYERDIDIAFIGNLFPGSGRSDLIANLSRRFRMNEPHYYRQDEIPAIYSRARIVLNLPLRDDLNFRTFEAMSCGAMLLTRRVNNGQEILFEENRHYVAFGDEKELLEKATYYLAHPGECDAIAAAGLAEVRLHHRLEMRVEELLTRVRESPGRSAPIRGMSPSGVDREYAWLYEYWRMADSGLRLAKEAQRAGRPWIPLLAPALRSTLRVLFR